MIDQPRRHVMFRRAAVGFGFALLLAFLPLPSFDFVSVAGATTGALPSLDPITTAQLGALQAAADEPLAAERVIGTEADVEQFETIGITMAAAPTDPVMVRVRDESGEWQDWRELELEVDEGPDASQGEGTGNFGTAPMWVDGARGYEVSLGDRDASDANVVLVRDHQERVVTDATPLAGAAPTLDGVRLRSAWGARESTGIGYAASVKLAVVHHSDSSNAYSPADVPGVLRSIQAYHMDGRGWADIAYNFVVDKYGGLWEGRGGGIDRPVIGAHSMGFNTGSVGVMVIGDYTQATPTAAALESVSRVIGWKLALHNVDPTGSADFVSGGSVSIPAGQVVRLSRVIGHQDVGATSCPGSIQGYLGSIRNRSQEWTDYIRPQLAPIGSLDSVSGGSASVSASGWAIDVGRGSAAVVRVEASGQTVDATANQSRPDVGAAYPGYGSAGYSTTLTGVRPGLQNVCARGLASFSAGYDALLGCRVVMVTDPTGRSPVGGISSVQVAAGQITAAGWALDPETSASAVINVLVDGGGAGAFAADRASSDVPGQYSGSVGTQHGFSANSVGIAGGTHNVCIQVTNVAQGYDVIADCRQVTVPGAQPMGSLDSVGTNGRTIVIGGWAMDRETVNQTNVLLTVDGRWYTVLANVYRPDIAEAFLGYGPQHGFAAWIEATPGTHQVCASALNYGEGSHSSLGCRTVSVVK